MKGDRLGEFEEFTLLAVRALGDHTYAVPVQRYVEDGHRPQCVDGRRLCRAGAARGQGLRALVDGRRDRAPRREVRSASIRVTPLGLKTARELHRVRDRIWNAIAEGRQS